MANQAQGHQKEKAARVAAKERGFGKWDFVRMAPLMGGISAFLMVVSLVLLATKGLTYGIDFTGGTEIQVRFNQPVEAAELRKVIEEAGVGNPSVQAFGSENEFLIRLETPTAETEKAQNDLIHASVVKLREAFKAKFNLPDEGILRVDTVGPQVGSELKRNGLLAMFYSLLVLLIYVSLRFDYKYAPGAVICLVHDALLTLGVFSLLGREFNVQIMAAVLTLIGYSLNDTIVTFDRIRETLPQNRDMSMGYVVNKGINETLGRTLLTAGTTLLALVALYMFAGGVIEDIAFTLIIGVIVGTYSSIYVAAPLILVMEKFKGPGQASAA